MSDTAAREQKTPHLETDKSRPEKTVSPEALQRLKLAGEAIAVTKKAIAHQGNQVPSLIATNMNSRYRLMAMRDPRAWEYTDEAAQLASQHREADVAAKADLANGGNCGEHAWVAFHWLRQNAAGQPINRVVPNYIDHAFVIIGDLQKDKDSEMAVSDPWTNAPMACLWEDHFAHGDRAELKSQATMVADGNSFKAAIGAGLRLSAYGQQLIKRADTDEQTKQQTDDWEKNHFWQQDDTRAEGAEFRYTAPTRQPSPSGGRREEARQ